MNNENSTDKYCNVPLSWALSKPKPYIPLLFVNIACCHQIPAHLHMMSKLFVSNFDASNLEVAGCSQKQPMYLASIIGVTLYLLMTIYKSNCLIIGGAHYIYICTYIYNDIYIHIYIHTYII